MRDHRALQAAEMLHLRQKLRGVGLERLGLRREARRNHRHEQTPKRRVMAGLDPATHSRKAAALKEGWMAGSSPAMTAEG